MMEKELKEILEYNPDTGIFIWLYTSRRAKKGNIAGSEDSEGYVQIKINKKLYYAHRLSWLYMTGEFPKKDIDHKNGVKNDNRFCNLREATRSQNCCNKGKTKLNTSGFKGVYFAKDRNKWRACIRKNGILKNLGQFSTPEEASEAYKKKAEELHGEFRRFE